MSGTALDEALAKSITFQIGNDTLVWGEEYSGSGFGLSWDEDNKAVKYGKLV